MVAGPAPHPGRLVGPLKPQVRVGHAQVPHLSVVELHSRTKADPAHVLTPSDDENLTRAEDPVIDTATCVEFAFCNLAHCHARDVCSRMLAQQHLGRLHFRLRLVECCDLQFGPLMQFHGSLKCLIIAGPSAGDGSRTASRSALLRQMRTAGVSRPHAFPAPRSLRAGRSHRRCGNLVELLPRADDHSCCTV